MEGSFLLYFAFWIIYYVAGVKHMLMALVAFEIFLLGVIWVIVSKLSGAMSVYILFLAVILGSAAVGLSVLVSSGGSGKFVV